MGYGKGQRVAVTILEGRVLHDVPAVIIGPAEPREGMRNVDERYDVRLADGRVIQAAHATSMRAAQ